MDAVKKYFFFILIGGVAVLTAVLYFVLVHPVRAQNAKIKKDLMSRRNELEEYAQKGRETKNERWLEYVEKEKKLIQEEVKKCRQFFAERDASFERLFYIDPDAATPLEIDDQATWKNRYIEECNRLVSMLNDAGVQCSLNSFDFRDWGSRVPTWPEIRQAQKEFWLQKSIAEILKDPKLKVKALIAFRFRAHETKKATPAGGGMMGMMGAAGPAGGMGAGGGPGEGGMMGMMGMMGPGGEGGGMGTESGTGGAPGVGDTSGEGAETEESKALFSPIPFDLQVDMEYERLPLLLNKLMHCDKNIVVETMDVVRAAEAGTGLGGEGGGMMGMMGMMGGGAGAKTGPGPEMGGMMRGGMMMGEGMMGGAQPGAMVMNMQRRGANTTQKGNSILPGQAYETDVRVTLHCESLDYNEPKKKKEEGSADTSGGGEASTDGGGDNIGTPF